MQQQISPLLQAKINNQTTITANQLTKNIDTPKINLKQETDSIKLSNKNKKKTIKIALIVAGAIAAVAGGFALSKRGVFGENLQNQTNKLWNNITSIFKKPQEPLQAPPKPIQNPIASTLEEETQGIANLADPLNSTTSTLEEETQGVASLAKKFISYKDEFDGVEIEGVELKKGKAILPDGSMFTGTMQTKNKAGKDISISYKNGLITDSTIDGKLFKTYSVPDKYSNIGRDKGVFICQYDENGKIIKHQCDFFHSDGKISKTVRSTGIINYNHMGEENVNILEFSPNGKKIAEYEALECGKRYYFPKGKIFNEDGTLKKEFVAASNRDITYLPDGTTVTRVYKDYELGNIDEQLATKNMSNCKSVTISDKDKKITDFIECNNDIFGSGDTRLGICHSDNTSKESKSITIRNNINSQYGDSTISITNSKEGKPDWHYRLTVDSENKSIKTEAKISKTEINEIIAMIENSNKRAIDENMYRINDETQNSEKIISSYETIIQSLKNYASTL